MTEPDLDAARKRRAAWTSRARFVGLVLVALAVGTVIPQLVTKDDTEEPRGATGSPERQHVAAWALHAEGGQTYLAVFAEGERPSVVLAVPAELTINLPGQNLGTLSEAAASGDQGLVEVALENLLGVPVDTVVLSPLSSLAGVVDDAGGVDVRGSHSSGSEVTSYLTDIPADAPRDLPFLRWQDVLDGLIQAEQPDVVPEPLRPALSGSEPSLVALPVVDIGGGLLRPDQDTLLPLVAEHFVLTTGDVVRLVVLNGVGTPGIGQEVARILVPEGYRLMSSGNANTFDLEETKIIASSREDLDAAERARALLGTGEVQLGNQAAGLADVTVVIGRDFGGS
jgi:LytR cell envelope-related transcriptional attenuator